jgi:hypothetical protein
VKASSFTQQGFVPARPGPALRCFAFLGWGGGGLPPNLELCCTGGVRVLSSPSLRPCGLSFNTAASPACCSGRATGPFNIQRPAQLLPPALPCPPPGPVPLPPLAYLKYNVAMLFCHFTIFLRPVLERGGRVCEAPSVTACRVAKLMPTSSLRM